jgi:hypothetical protein
MATLCNKKFSGYQPCQLVKRRKKNQRFEDHLCPRLQGTDVTGESVCVFYCYISALRSTVNCIDLIMSHLVDEQRTEEQPSSL